MSAAEVDPDAFLVDGPARARRCFVFAHGAGAPMDSPFMQHLATGLAADGVRVVRFEFPYMALRRQAGTKRAPNPQRVLEEHFRAVLDAVGRPERLWIGGKSMGGRIASQIADAVGVRGVACLGYPFHPPGKPEKLRTAHLQVQRTPTLIVQGERDTFGGREEVADYGLADTVEVVWLPDGDHSFKPRVRSGHTEAENLDAAVAAVAGFLH